MTPRFTDSRAHCANRVAPDLSWSYRMRPTGMSGKERRGGGAFGGRGRSYEARRQRVLQTLRFTGMTAVEGLGRVDELTDGTVRSIDAATVAVGRSISGNPDNDGLSRRYGHNVSPHDIAHHLDR